MDKKEQKKRLTTLKNMFATLKNMIDKEDDMKLKNQISTAYAVVQETHAQAARLEGGIR